MSERNSNSPHNDTNEDSSKPDPSIPAQYRGQIENELSTFLETTLIRLSGAITWLHQTRRGHIAVFLIKAEKQLDQALQFLGKGGEK